MLWLENILELIRNFADVTRHKTVKNHLLFSILVVIKKKGKYTVAAKLHLGIN